MCVLNVCVLNAQSAGRKTDEIVQYIVEKDIDVCVITESWLKSDDNVRIGDLEPSGYKLKQVFRDDRRGGGIAIIYRTTCKLNVLAPTCVSEAFECMEAIITSGNGNMRLIVVYRPQHPDPAIGHSLQLYVFFDDFSKIMDNHLTAPGKLLVTRDFNFHVDIPDDPEDKCMLVALDMMDLHQLVNEPTHKDGHTLYLIITRRSEVDFVKDVYVDLQISDHYVLSFRDEIEKPSPEQKVMAFRKTRSVDTEIFMNDIRVQVSELGSCYNIEDRVDQYNTILSQFLDEYAPEMQYMITISTRPHGILKNYIKKRSLQNLKRTERSSKDKVQNMNSTLKKEFYSSTVKQQKNNPKGLFRVINTFLHKRKDLPLPPHESASELAEEFSHHFAGKLEKVRRDLIQLQGYITDTDDEIKNVHNRKVIFNTCNRRGNKVYIT